MDIYIIKWILAIATTLATLFVLWRRPISHWPFAITLALALLIRLIPLIVFHGPMHVRYPTDVSMYYEHVERVMAGQVPNREFSTPYGLGFTYILALPAFIIKSPLTLVVFFQVAEFCGVYFFIRALRTRLGAERSQLLALLYAVNPLAVVNLWFSAQDESLQVFAVGVLAMLVTSGRWLLAPIAAAALMHVTKMFTALMVAPFLVVRSVREWAVFLLVMLLPILLALSVGSRVYSTDFTKNNAPPDVLVEMKTSGNLWFLVDQVSPSTLTSKLPQIVTLACLSACGLYLLSLRSSLEPMTLFLAGTCLVNVVFLATYKMTHAQYATVIVAPLLALAIPRNGQAMALVLSWTILVSSHTHIAFGYFDGSPSPSGRIVVIFYNLLINIAHVAMVIWLVRIMEDARTTGRRSASHQGSAAQAATFPVPAGFTS